jgi:hypothetical protein
MGPKAKSPTWLGNWLRGALQAIAGLLPSQFMRVQFCFLMHASQIAKSDRDVDKRFAFEWATERDLPEVAALSGRSTEVLATRLREGDHCRIVRYDSGRIVHCTWLHWGPCYVLGLAHPLWLSPNDAYVYWVHTEKYSRKQGLYAHVLAEIDILVSDISTAGTIFAITEDRNEISILAHSQLGFQWEETIACIKIWWFVIQMRRKEKRRWKIWWRPIPPAGITEI